MAVTMHRLGHLARAGCHGLGGLLFLLAAALVGWTAGDCHWPYVVQSVDVEPDPVHPGGSLRVTAVRTYRADCDLRYDRRIESVADRARPPVLLPSEEERTPWRFDGRPQTVGIAIPPDFPCGPAQLRTTPSASCNWLQRGPFRQRARDGLTPFDVACR